MKNISQLATRSVRVVLTDIDGTLTQHGRLPANSYNQLWALVRAGLHVIPVTGRPAGWCEMIARLWPVHGVVGENGAFYFLMKEGKMRRHFAREKKQRSDDRVRLKTIAKEILQAVPGCQVASDQFSRLFDLAIDFSEDVKPLAMPQVKKIAAIFAAHGATAKISNIHVNGWFGDHDKLSTCKLYLAREFGMSEAEMMRDCVFVGDSPNDEPMFAFFPNACAVSNIRAFVSELKAKPSFVANSKEADGFCEIADRLLELRSTT